MYPKRTKMARCLLEQSSSRRGVRLLSLHSAHGGAAFNCTSRKNLCGSISRIRNQNITSTLSTASGGHSRIRQSIPIDPTMAIISPCNNTNGRLSIRQARLPLHHTP